VREVAKPKIQVGAATLTSALILSTFTGFWTMCHLISSSALMPCATSPNPSD
jgi:hypothetical protein